MNRIPTFENFLNESRDWTIHRIMAEFFRVHERPLHKFKLDGTDDIKELTKALNGTSEEGVANVIRVYRERNPHLFEANIPKNFAMNYPYTPDGLKDYMWHNNCYDPHSKTCDKLFQNFANAHNVDKREVSKMWNEAFAKK